MPCSPGPRRGGRAHGMGDDHGRHCLLLNTSVTALLFSICSISGCDRGETCEPAGGTDQRGSSAARRTANSDGRRETQTTEADPSLSLIHPQTPSPITGEMSISPLALLTVSLVCAVRVLSYPGAKYSAVHELLSDAAAASGWTSTSGRLPLCPAELHLPCAHHHNVPATPPTRRSIVIPDILSPPLPFLS
jgi:hypothetical protein